MKVRKARFSFFRRLGLYFPRVVDVFLPPHSLLTGLPVADEEVQLWQQLKFLDAPCCDHCGYPFEFDQGKEALCGSCIAHPPKYHRGRSAIVYNEDSRKIVLDFKHGGRTDGLSFFGAQMMRAGREMLEQADMIIPVPLHASRLRKRKFNQSAVLARKLSQLSGVPYMTDFLLRCKNTPSQGNQSFAGRRRNVVGAFHISEQEKSNLTGMRIVLVDDVFTSGATVEACTQVLMRAGASQVNILTLMRVVRPVSIPT